MRLDATMPMDKFVLTWLDSVKRSEVKSATLDRLYVSLDALKEFTISHMVVKDITEFDFRDYVDELIEYGYKLTTIKKQMRIVSAPLQYAYDKALIPNNPCRSVKCPPEALVKRKKKEIVAYDKEQQAAIRAVTSTLNHTAYKAVEILLETGMRAGELIALNWDDIVLSDTRNYIKVHATAINLNCVQKLVIQEGAKSKTSNRIIPLSPRALEIMKELKARATKEYVFEDDFHNRMSYKCLTKHCKMACEKADVPYYGLHVWRHTFATNQYYKGTDIKILSKLLGHSTTSITYNIYIHLYGDAYDEMAAAVM